MGNVIQPYLSYTKKYPAVSLCLNLLLASGFGVTLSPLVLALALVFFTFEFLIRSSKLLVIVQLFLFLVISLVAKEQLAYKQSAFERPTKVATLSILDEKKQTIYGKKVQHLRGYLRIDGAKHKVTSTLPHANALNLNTLYKIENFTLKKRAEWQPRIVLDKSSRFTPIVKQAFSIAGFRSSLRTLVHKKIQLSMKNKQVKELIFALCFGYSFDKNLKFEFGKLGLQHLLAISGFHFGLVSLFLGILFKKLLPTKLSYLLLLFCMTFFMLYIGDTPSVLRAYLSISIYLLGLLFQARPSAINSLALSASLLLLFDPLNILSLGFQLSYLATFAILSLFPFMLATIEKILPKRSFKKSLNLSLGDQYILIFTEIFKSALALDLAISLMTLGPIFFHIGSYPPFSFLYNLIIPPLISITMILVISALCIPIPVVSHCLLKTCEGLTSKYLFVIANPPPLFNQSIYMSLNFETALCLVCFGLLLAIYTDYQKEQSLVFQ